MNREIIIEKLKLDGLLLSDLEDHFKSDKELVIIAIQENPYAIQFAALPLRDDVEVVEAALRGAYYSQYKPNPGRYSIIHYASERIRSDEDLLFSWLQYDHELVHYFPKNYLSEEYFMKKAVTKNGMVIRFASQEIKGNRVIVLLAAKENGIFLTYPGFNQFLNDREIMFEACKSDSEVIEILPDQFKNDYQFVFEIFSKSYVGGSAIRAFPESLRHDKEIILNGFLLNRDLLLPVLNKIDLMDDDEFIFNLYKSGLPKLMFAKPFSEIIIASWKKNGLMDEDNNKGVRGKHNLMERIIEIYPEAEIHFQKFRNFDPLKKKRN